MERIGRYEVLRTLASGVVSEVYLVGHDAVCRPLALKRLRPHMFDDWKAVGRFRDGAALATTLQHPNIVAAHCVGGADDEAFVVTDYVDGLDVEELVDLTDTVVPPQIAVSIALGAACGLKYAHAGPFGRPIVHRSLSPRSIRIGVDGRVKLVDFGTSTAAVVTEWYDDFAYDGPTMYGSAWQYLDGYRSGDDWEPQCHQDVFSFGAVLYELCTGVGPFAGDTALDVFSKTIADPIAPPSELAEVPAALERVIMTALSRDRRRRYPTAEVLWRELEALAAEPDLAPSRARVAAYVRPLVCP